MENTTLFPSKTNLLLPGFMVVFVGKLTDRIMVVDMGIDKTLVVVKIIDKTGSE
jgi:hypothetical protein